MITKNGMGNFDFEKLLSKSVSVHGHLCAGQVLGVKMAILGLRKIAITDPQETDRKKLIVFVEIDRCATDAIQSVTNCSLGKRTMKFMDYGKMAATFYNLDTGRVVRVIAKEDSRDRAKHYFPDIKNKYDAQLAAYKIMSDDELFDCMDVYVELRPEDMPGRPIKRVKCNSCGEYVQDKRDVIKDRQTLCKVCDQGGYYKIK